MRLTVAVPVAISLHRRCADGNASSNTSSDVSSGAGGGHWLLSYRTFQIVKHFLPFSSFAVVFLVHCQSDGVPTKKAMRRTPHIKATQW
jgi:hypothetical protein